MYKASDKTAQISVGLVIESRGGSRYTVCEVWTEGRARGFSIVRESSGKVVRISDRKVQATLARLEAGELLAFQASPRNGGISYTVAEEAGVVAALAPLVETDRGCRVYRLKR